MGSTNFKTKLYGILGHRMTSISYAVIAFVITFILYYNIHIVGFPDGHKTDYEIAAQLPLIIVNCINLVFAFYFLYRGIFASSRIIRIKLHYVIFIHLLFLIISMYGIKFFFKVYMNLEDGQGG